MSPILGFVLMWIALALVCDNVAVIYMAMKEDEEKHGAIVVDPLKKKGKKK